MTIAKRYAMAEHTHTEDFLRQVNELAKEGYIVTPNTFGVFILQVGKDKFQMHSVLMEKEVEV